MSLLTQNAEFATLADLTREFNRLNQTPVVDDDYLEIRNQYERALREFLKACRENGRAF